MHLLLMWRRLALMWQPERLLRHPVTDCRVHGQKLRQREGSSRELLESFLQRLS
ncbi:hypothetical protein COCSUDRAFT_34129 [Coccomyxa subellipsoidea C-169]|uniref:Uncharacterized protein n=1 Tax=Coccomyxa subellipsoidea (strain C-169) TaxID=574566 RepID=I0YNF3_COCSC|nr:hypothetical protein COCSUDRAFT_34129 [Coccomyxa subellipsoidea C-169]EIE19922.1 hypothetical protein COCSUDRAFT_34129 [Coccomyxa subellipsoidea C-169]|eukprot:XP_005644466.1 hypothetical protein COCSUDRAFT_34129 [Coccomyxa subellipsoidea C-169]